MLQDHSLQKASLCFLAVLVVFQVASCGSFVEAYHWSFLSTDVRNSSDNTLANTLLSTKPEGFYLDVKLNARLISAQSSPGAQGKATIKPNAYIDSIAVFSLDTFNTILPNQALNMYFKASYKKTIPDKVLLSEFIRMFARSAGQVEDEFLLFLENKPTQAKQRFVVRIATSDRRILLDTLPKLTIE